MFRKYGTFNFFKNLHFDAHEQFLFSQVVVLIFYSELSLPFLHGLLFYLLICILSIYFFTLFLCVLPKNNFLLCLCAMFFFTSVHRKVACLTLGMQLQVSPSTATNLYSIGGQWKRGGVVVFVTRHAVANVALNYNCMSTSECN